MYENPKLNRIGDVRDVVLGYIPTGNDIDTNWVYGQQEFADDRDTFEDAVPPR